MMGALASKQLQGAFQGHVSITCRRVTSVLVLAKKTLTMADTVQANIIPVVWDRVELHHLEEVSYGVWQPMLSTR